MKLRKKQTELEKEKLNLLKYMSMCKKDEAAYAEYARAYKELAEAGAAEDKRGDRAIAVIVPVVCTIASAVVQLVVTKSVTSFEEADVITSKVNQFIRKI